jgi:hypothetical protein
MTPTDYRRVNVALIVTGLVLLAWLLGGVAA